MARYRGKAPSPQAGSSGAAVASPEFHVDADGDTDWDLADLKAADEPLEYTVLKTKFTELQEACGRADVVASSFMIDVVDLALGCVSVRVAGVSELQVKYDCLTA